MMQNLLYFCENLNYKSGHWYSTLHKLSNSLPDLRALIVVPRLSEFDGQEIPFVSSVANKLPQASASYKLSCKMVNRCLSDMISLPFLFITEFIRFIVLSVSLGKFKSRFEGPVFLMDPSLGLLMWCLFTQRPKRQILVYYAVPPESSSIKISRASILKLIAAYSKIASLFNSRCVFLFDDVFIIRRLGNLKNVFEFPYTLGLPEFSPRQRISGQILLPGSTQTAKNYKLVLAHLEELGEDFCSRNALKCLARIDNCDLCDFPRLMGSSTLTRLPYLGFYDYLDLIVTSDLVILPYNPKVYGVEGSSSGIVRECLYYGTPILSLSDSWISGFLGEFQCTEKLLLATEKNISSYIEKFFANRVEYRETYQKMSSEYRSQQALTLRYFLSMIR